MATADDSHGAVETFLEERGHDADETWDRSYNKLQCPDCGGLHDESASTCSVCGWRP